MRNSLFFKVFIFITIVSSVVLGISFYFLKSYQEKNLYENLETFTYQISNTIKGTLYHAMLTNNRDAIQNIVENASKQKGIDNVFIIDRTGKIFYSTFREEIGKTLNKNDASCLICHGTSKKPEVATILYEKPNGEKVFRNVNPIYSAPACYGCHDSKEKIRGVLITDISADKFEEQIASNLKKMSLAFLIVFIALGFTLFYTISKLILTPLNTLVSGTKEISSGNLDYKIPLNRTNEIEILGTEFNKMAGSLKEKIDEIKAYSGKLEKANRQLEQNILQVYTLYNISKALSTTFEIEKLLNQVVENVNQALRVQKINVMLVNEARTELYIIAGIGVSRELKDIRYKIGDNIYGWVAMTGQGELINNLSTHPKFNPLKGFDDDATSLICTPFKGSNHEVLGVINAYRLSEDSFDEISFQLLTTVALQVGMALQNVKLYEETKLLSITDGMTSLYNYRHFIECLNMEFERAKRYKRPLSLIMIDIDFFKQYNDTNGHLKGDELLRNISEIFKQSVRKSDTVARYGGEEFVVILPETEGDMAFTTAERFRKKVEANDFEGGKTQPGGRVTISLGVAFCTEEAESCEGLVKRADNAMYRAKEEGRNRVVGC